MTKERLNELERIGWDWREEGEAAEIFALARRGLDDENNYKLVVDRVERLLRACELAREYRREVLWDYSSLAAEHAGEELETALAAVGLPVED